MLRVAGVRLRHRGLLELLGTRGQVISTRQVDWEVELDSDEDGSPFSLGAITFHAGGPDDGWAPPPRDDLQLLADRCRHARLGYLDGRPGTLEDVVARLDELDRCVRWWQALVQRLVRERGA